MWSCQNTTKSEISIFFQARSTMKFPESPACFRAIGITLGIMSSLFFATGMLCFKLVHDISSPQIVFFRVCFAASLTASYTALKHQPIFVARNPYVWLIGICCIVTNYFFFFALSILSMGDASAIFSAQPIIVGIFAYIFLKENFDLVDAAMTFIVIIGVVLVVQPIFLFHHSNIKETPLRGVTCEIKKLNLSLSLRLQYAANKTDATTFVNSQAFTTEDDEEFKKLNSLGNIIFKCVNATINGSCKCTMTEGHTFQDGALQLSRYWACSLVLLTAIASAIIFFLNGKTTDEFHGTIMTHSNFVVVFGGLLMTTALGDWCFPQKVAPWSWIGAMTLSMICAQVCEIMASKYETATVLAIIKSFQTPFCFVWDIVFLREFPWLLDAIGALLVTGAILVFVIRRYLRDKDSVEEDNEMQTIIAK
jgi:drug/metabolite transporter (DMT)-like permease